MNGRIYDPRLGRFLQADPMVQAPKNGQNLNRYSYVLNNPLSYTDPSGYFLSRLFKKWIRPIASITVSIVGMIVAPQLAPVWGALSGFIASGNVKGLLVGAFSGALFAGIGAHFEAAALANEVRGITNTLSNGLTHLQYASKIAAHSIAGGIMSSISGGEFGHGFAAAGFAQAFANPIGTVASGNIGFSARRTVVAAVVGGTATELSGGKFANGAVTGAFSRAFNDELEGVRFKRFKRALQRQKERVLSARRFNVEQQNAYSGSHIGSYIYQREGHFTLESAINVNQASINAGNPTGGWNSDPQQIPEDIAALVIAVRQQTAIDNPIENRELFQRHSKLIGAPIFVAPWSRFPTNILYRFDANSCAYYPSGKTC